MALQAGVSPRKHPDAWPAEVECPYNGATP
jgi:hypothetical protein